MTVDITLTSLVAVEDDYLQAVWTLMQGDDDLAHDLIHRSIFSGITRIVQDMPYKCWTPEDYFKILSFLDKEKAVLEERTEEMAERFMTYSRHR